MAKDDSHAKNVSFFPFCEKEKKQNKTKKNQNTNIESRMYEKHDRLASKWASNTWMDSDNETMGKDTSLKKCGLMLADKTQGHGVGSFYPFWLWTMWLVWGKTFLYDVVRSLLKGKEGMLCRNSTNTLVLVAELLLAWAA